MSAYHMFHKQPGNCICTLVRKPHVQSEELPKGNVNYWPKHDKAIEEFVPIRDRVCFNCRQTGHISNNCPKPRRQEAPGQSRGPLVSKPSRNAVVEFKESTESMISPECLSIQELQDLLAQQQLREEQKLLDSNVSVIVVRTNAVTATENDESLKAVGPSVYLSVRIGGVMMDAMVDTGAQSTIISRSLLHKVGQHMKSRGQSLPVLERPTARLFGKDGKGGGRELTITAQLQVKVEADGESVCVPVFVQPQSEQDCLLGMNVLPALGLAITRANGESLISKHEASSKVAHAHVSLVQSSTIPSLKGQFLKIQPDCTLTDCKSEVLLEPQLDIFESLGLRTHESVVTVLEDGYMHVPVQNCDGVNVRLEQGTDVSGIVGSGSGIVGSVSGIVGSVSGIVGSVSGIVGSVSGIVGSVSGIVGSVSGIVAESTEVRCISECIVGSVGGIVADSTEVRYVSECIVGSVGGIVADSTEVRYVSECIVGSVGDIAAGSTEEVDIDIDAGCVNRGSESLSEAEKMKSSVCSCVDTVEHFEKLVESLELPKEKLGDSQVVQLRELLNEYSDIFALSVLSKERQKEKQQEKIARDGPVTRAMAQINV